MSDVDLEHTYTSICPRCGRTVAAGTEHRCEQRVPILDQNGVEVGVAVALNPFCGFGPTTVTLKDIFEEMLDGHTSMRKASYIKPGISSRPVTPLDFVRAGMAKEG